MAYSVLEDLLKMIPEEELAQITTESGDDPDPTIVAEAISQADAEIDSYLGRRYQVPLSPVPPRVKALSVDLAIYHLYSRRSVAPPVRRQNYEAAVAFLKQVAAGQAVVEVSGGEPPGVNRDVGELTSATRVFRRDTLGEW
jgi:phage gp36-like protein